MFGMGTGGSLRLLSPEILCGCQILLDPSNDFQITIHIVIQPLSGLFESFSHTLKTAQGIDLKRSNITSTDF